MITVILGRDEGWGSHLDFFKFNTLMIFVTTVEKETLIIDVGHGGKTICINSSVELYQKFQSDIGENRKGSRG